MECKDDDYPGSSIICLRARHVDAGRKQGDGRVGRGHDKRRSDFERVRSPHVDGGRVPCREDGADALVCGGDGSRRGFLHRVLRRVALPFVPERRAWLRRRRVVPLRGALSQMRLTRVEERS